MVASTSQEASEQYPQYDNYRKTRTSVIPPGVDLNHFHPPKRFEPHAPIQQRITRFLEHPDRPWILAIARPDERKNFPALIDAYGQSPELQEIANLTNGSYYYAEDAETLQEIYRNIDLQLTVGGDEMEVTALVAGLSFLLLLAGGGLSMFWFGRVP